MHKLTSSLRRGITKIRALNRKKNYFIKELKHRVRLYVAMLFWDLPAKKSFVLSTTKTVLLMRNEGAIGDVVIDTALIKALHKAGYTIDFLLTESNSQVVQYNPCLRYIYKVKTLSSECFMKKLTHNIPDNIIKQLHENKYDIVIDPSLFQIPVHRILLLKQINAKNVIGFNKWNNIQHYNKNFSIDCEHQHISEIYFPVGRLLNLQQEYLTGYCLHYPESVNAEVNTFLASFPHNNRNVIINIFAGNADRCLSEQQLRLIVEKITQRYNNVNIIVLDHKQRINLAGLPDMSRNPFTTLHHTMALISQADLVISPDTSVVHISAVWKKPLIAFYRDIKGNNNLWAPGYPQAIQIIMQKGKLHQQDNIESIVMEAIENNQLL